MFQTSSLRKEINKLLDDQRNAVQDLNLHQADLLKAEIENRKKKLQDLNEEMNTDEEPTKKTDPITILKCVNIITELLQSPDIIKLNNSLKTLRDELLKDLLCVGDTAIQSKIMQCYAILCSFEKDSSADCLKLFAPIVSILVICQNQCYQI